jgi:hypothetical protein
MEEGVSDEVQGGHCAYFKDYFIEVYASNK